MTDFIKLTPKLHAHVGATLTQYVFYCPGCQDTHIYYVGEPDGQKPRWKFNGDIHKPSFTESLVVTGRPPSMRYRITRCHLYVTDGQIHYCPDCDHDLACRVVDLPDIPA